MFFLRKLGKLLRGNATAFQIISACLLGFVMAFAPAPSVAPGFYILVFAAVMILNCNLLLFGVSLVVGYLCSLLLIPAAFAIGQTLMHSPLEGVFQALAAMPVIAWMGFDTYLMPGAWLLGGALGVGFGLWISKLLHVYLRKMAELEEGSERFSKMVGNPAFKALAFVFLGGFSGKTSFRERLRNPKKTLPIRISGAVAVVLGALTLALGIQMFDNSFFTTRTRDVLSRYNGSTVDLELLRIDVFSGKVEVRGLAASDPEGPTRNRIAIDRATADLDVVGLLSRRVRVEELALVDVIADGDRRLTGVSSDAPKEIPASDRPLIPPDMNHGELIAWLDAWKERLEKARDSWESVKKHLPEESEVETGAAESWQDVLARDIEAHGYRSVRAHHILPSGPAFEIGTVTVDGIWFGDEPDSVFGLQAHNVSSDPALAEQSMEIELFDRSEQFRVALTAHALRAEQPHDLMFSARTLPVSLIRRWLPGNVRPHLKAGTFSVTGEGTWAEALDISLMVTFENLELDLPVLGLTLLDELEIPGRIGDSPQSPEFSLDQQAMADSVKSLLRSGAGERAQEELKDRAGNILKGLFGN